MGFLQRLVGEAISEGIGNGIRKAVEGAVEKAVRPAADNLAQSAADSINDSANSLNEAREAAKEASSDPQVSSAYANLQAATLNFAKEMEGITEKYEKDEDARNKAEAEIVVNTALKNFPKWDLSPLVSTSSDEEDEFVAINLQVEATEENVEQYRYKLEADGFTGDWQIQRKYIDGHEHVVDFTFSLDNNEIRYLIMK